MLGLTILTLLFIEMEAAPKVFDPGGIMEVWDLAWGYLLLAKDRQILWYEEFQIRVMEEEDEEMMICPPPEPPPWRNCAARVWKNVLLFLFLLFSAQTVLLCFSC
ncbi:unnamed protein product [Cuscuta epithymum]|uniref:Uncharacterized protein n=1 Tax=Cuscuta epithymum TaxID=186058 RepID=A0AAV0BZB6_9ASTE|nr:unnamed protein product [Cuscuta epithymum]